MVQSSLLLPFLSTSGEDCEELSPQRSGKDWRRQPILLTSIISQKSRSALHAGQSRKKIFQISCDRSRQENSVDARIKNENGLNSVSKKSE